MATQRNDPNRILDDIAADFAALAQLIERAIASLAPHGTVEADIEALRRARDSAEYGASLARGNFTLQ